MPEPQLHENGLVFSTFGNFRQIRIGCPEHILLGWDPVRQIFAIGGLSGSFVHLGSQQGVAFHGDIEGAI